MPSAKKSTANYSNPIDAVRGENPERLPRRQRGVPVVTSIAVFDAVKGGVDERVNLEHNQYGCWIVFKWKWDMPPGVAEDYFGDGYEGEAGISIEDAELFELLKDRLLVAEKNFVPISDVLLPRNVPPAGVLAEDIDWCNGDPPPLPENPQKE